MGKIRHRYSALLSLLAVVGGCVACVTGMVVPGKVRVVLGGCVIGDIVVLGGSALGQHDTQKEYRAANQSPPSSQIPAIMHISV